MKRRAAFAIVALWAATAGAAALPALEPEMEPGDGALRTEARGRAVAVRAEGLAASDPARLASLIEALEGPRAPRAVRIGIMPRIPE
jgi:hypothetical protein